MPESQETSEHSGDGATMPIFFGGGGGCAGCASPDENPSQRTQIGFLGLLKCVKVCLSRCKMDQIRPPKVSLFPSCKYK